MNMRKMLCKKKIHVGNVEIESNGRIFQDTPPNFVATMRSLRVDMQRYIEDNEIMIKAQEEHNQLNEAMLQSLTDMQRNMNSRHWAVNPEGSKSNTRRRKRSSSGSFDSEGSTRVQALHLTKIRGTDVTRTVHVMNLRRQSLLPLMVR